MGTTPNLALPFPEDHDPLADVAQAIENLALALDTQLQAGVWNSGTLVAGTAKTVAVVFETPYPSGVVPVVTTGVQNVGNASGIDTGANAVTNTGFTLTVTRAAGTGALHVAWQAQRPTQ